MGLQDATLQAKRQRVGLDGLAANRNEAPLVEFLRTVVKNQLRKGDYRSVQAGQDNRQ